MNTPEQMSWDDVTKLAHYEKVVWWQHYIQKMLQEGKISHAWGTHDFCDIRTFSARSAAAAVIYNVDSLAEFAEAYKTDPLRQRGRFWSIMLRPISEQKSEDEAILERTLRSH
jgi:hypothetical protein